MLKKRFAQPLSGATALRLWSIDNVERSLDWERVGFVTPEKFQLKPLESYT
ncbi:hypothetical protein GN286_12795 [Rhodobacteraceae bacterium IMCC15231]|nr:hypothetical protein [Rhodobacteraceae bacterium IMCC15231]